MVSEAELQDQVIHMKASRPVEDGVREGPATSNLAETLRPFTEGYRDALKRRAKLSFISGRRMATTPYQTFLYQEGMDNLRMAIGELETDIAKALNSNIENLIADYLRAAVQQTLERSLKRREDLPDPPRLARDVRTILYRMYRGGSFYPLVFPREVELEFYRVLGDRISMEGMRGNEIASQTRKLAIRNRLDVRGMIRESMEKNGGLASVGLVRWSWRRGSVVRRIAYAPPELLDEAGRVASVLDAAVSRRHVVSGSRATL